MHRCDCGGCRGERAVDAWAGLRGWDTGWGSIDGPVGAVWVLGG
jgi:hypothetical protein